MTDEEWEKRQARTIASAFQTGRPVFADKYACKGHVQTDDHWKAREVVLNRLRAVETE